MVSENNSNASDDSLKDLAGILSKEISIFRNNDHIVERLSQSVGEGKSVAIVQQIRQSNKKYYLNMSLFCIANVIAVIIALGFVSSYFTIKDIIGYSWWALLVGFLSLLIGGNAMDSLNSLIRRYELIFMYVSGISFLLLAGSLFIQGDWSYMDISIPHGGLAILLFLAIKIIVFVGPIIWGIASALIGLLMISGFYAAVKNEI